MTRDVSRITFQCAASQWDVFSLMPKQDQGIDVSLKRQRYAVIPRTLVFITRADCVLLLRGSAQKRIWANKYNGIGGHIERDE